MDDDENNYDYWDNGFSYYPIMNPEAQGNILVKVASPNYWTAYLDIYIIAEADRGNELFGRYRYVYVDEDIPEILRLRGIVSSLEGKPMTWMAMRAGVCEDYTAGQAAFAAGQYESAAKWVTGKTDTGGVYTLEAPLPEDAKGTVGVILEGTLLCKWPGAGDRTAFFLTDDSDGLANGTPMRVATFLTVDLDSSRAAARDGDPPTIHHHLNFQTLLTSGGWSNNYTGPDPVSLHPSGSARITVRDNFANTVTLYNLSGEQRLAEASVTYQSAVAASFFGAAVLDEEVMSGANLPIHLRSKGAEALISSYFNGDPGKASVHIEARDSRNDDDGRFAVLHEMGHAFDFITNGNAYRTLQGEMPGDRNHGGYMNGSTADSYTEGFATAFAAWVQLYGAYPNPEVVSVWSLDVPYRYRAWGQEGRDEELAIAAFLYQTFFHMRDMKGYWSILKPPLDNFAEYYDALVGSPLNPDSGKSRRDAITLGLFKMPYAGNGKYDRGEPYIDANNSGGWDDGEPFDDVNTNGIYDPGEDYDDINSNGSWDAAEPFEDDNHNGRYDRGEDYDDKNGNGFWNAAEPFDDRNGNGSRDTGETFTDNNNNNIYDGGEPYADLIFGDGTFDLFTEYPIRPYDENALVAGEAGDFNRAGRRTPPKLPNGFLRLEGESVDSVLVTVIPEDGKATRSLRAVGGSSVFLLVPDMYAAGTVRVDIPGGGRIY
ncbi:MAG: hypothetical protein GX592_08830, partial [Clostridiales bacterium]|nr:hypothetical protein [Clostridiales bacterium]